jgi:glutathione S-transferase
VTKYALAHKGFDIEIVPGGFTGIMERTGGRSERLPAIVDDGEWVLDSWLIAEYLDRKYPERPTLCGDPGIKPLAQFLEGWLWRTAITPWFGCYIKDYRDLSLPQDHEYVTRSRENMLGRKIEEVQAGREDRLPLVPPTLEPFRQLFHENKWLGGDKPNYATTGRWRFLDRVGRDDAAADRRRSPARLARPGLRPVRRTRPPPRHAHAVRPEAAPGRSGAVHQGVAAGRARQ